LRWQKWVDWIIFIPNKKFMEKRYFYLKLIARRPTFAQDMMPEERAVMMQHIAYWKKFMDEGKVLVFGPVLDPSGVYGMGIVKTDDEEEVKALIAGDPAGQINRYEYYPMRAVVKE
jgi:uncharacterized protein YciI